jgi:branched-chain amino acid transport system permease protein
VNDWFGEATGQAIIDWSVPLSILFAIPVMIAIGVIMERGLIKHFYKRPHADQILVTFGLAIVLQEIVKYYYGANQIPTPAPEAFIGSFDFGALIGMDPGSIIYPYWRIVYFCFAMILNRCCVCLLAVHNIRHGCSRRYGRSRNSRPIGHQH